MAFDITKKPELSSPVGPRRNRLSSLRSQRPGCVQAAEHLCLLYMLCHFLCRAEDPTQVHMKGESSCSCEPIEISDDTPKHTKKANDFSEWR